jgi:F0F1-type ATP synthase delta subunit
MGKAGKISMVMFENAFEREGHEGVTNIEKELSVLAYNVRDDIAWRVETTSAFFDKEWKHELVTKRLKGWGASNLLIDLVLDLVDQGDIRRLQQISVDYEEVMRAYRKEVDVTLTTARPISSELLEIMKKTIHNEYLKPTDNLIFAHVVDKKIVRGYKVKVRGQERDFSWRTSLNAWKAENARVAAARTDAVRAKQPSLESFSPEVVLKEFKAEKEAANVLPADAYSRTIKLLEDRASHRATIIAAHEKLSPERRGQLLKKYVHAHVAKA